MIVALARSGVRLMPSIPSTMAPATTNHEEAPDVGDDARRGGHTCPGPRRPGSVGRLVGHSFEDTTDHLGAQPGDDERQHHHDEDAEWPHDEVGDRGGGVGADAELGEQVVEPAPSLIDLIGAARALAGCPPGQGAAPGRVRSRPVFCPRIRVMTTLARTHVCLAPQRAPFDYILVIATGLVAVIGVVMVYTATRGTLQAHFEDPKTFLKKQALFVVLGVITMVGMALIDYRRSVGGHAPLRADHLVAAGGDGGGEAAPRVPPAGSASVGHCRFNPPRSRSWD